MAPPKFSVLFLGKADDPDCARALDFCLKEFSPVTSALGRWGDPLPAEARNWSGDYIISYLSRWILVSSDSVFLPSAFLAFSSS